MLQGRPLKRRPVRPIRFARLTAQGLRQGSWNLKDALGAEVYVRQGDDLADNGLYLDVAPHAAQLFRFTRA